MYITSVKLISAVILATVTATISVVQAQTLPSNQAVPGNWPVPDMPPPPVASWTALVDQTKLPNAAVKTIPYTCDAGDPWCSWSCTTCTRPEIDITYCPNKTDWALTYDDGPGPNTLKVLSALESKGVKATFFVVGSRVLQHPDILKQTVAAGHQIGVHTWSHTLLTTQTNEEIIAEIKWTETIIKNVTGLTPKLMRPPGGDMDDRVRGIMSQLGYKVAIWNHDTFDWESNLNPKFNLDWITNNFSIWVHNISNTGSISLEHDLFNSSSSKIPAALDIVTGAGFEVKQISNCVNNLKPYVEDVTLPASPSRSNSTAKSKSSGTSSLTPKYLVEFIMATLMLSFMMV
ncbi:927_t:CDS:2 [Acaulospora colombiana]|uniref:927_t:CDS:1 n=1 Tax=Acaulospora colombiana TaxID=27376 RepID=A0ACA9MS56_9GLOM|nr:927_t:CDS:2 [Acaulospora colombiana]